MQTTNTQEAPEHHVTEHSATIPNARLLTRAQLESHVAPRDLGRYSINGIYIASEGTWSTDGRILWCVPWGQEDIAEAPLAMQPDESDSLPDGQTIPLSAVAKLLKVLPKGGPRPILETASVSMNRTRLHLRCTDLENAVDLKALPCEGEFPNYRRVMDRLEERSEEARVCLSLEVLEKVLKAAKKAGAACLELGVSTKSDEAPVTVAARRQSDSGELLGPAVGHGIMMPMTVA